MAGDDLFGPYLPGFFDFTVLFEQSILSLLPTALFILFVPVRVFQVVRRPVCVRSGPLLWSKLAAVVAFFGLHVALIALWSLPSAPRTKTSVAEAVLGVVGSLAIAALSYTEHRKSVKPSALLSCYLLLTALLDIALVRTFWIRPGLHAIAGVSTVALVVKIALLVLEESPKPRIVGDTGTASETVAGVVSRSLFWWLNTLFYAGARLLLGVEDLGRIEEKLDSRKLLGDLEKAWNDTPKTSKIALLKCSFWAYRWQFAAGILPRLLYSGFSFAQPFLISSVVDFVGEPEHEHSDSIAGGLIGATAIVYIGLAVSNAWFKHMTFQLLTMFRGGLASLVFKKTLVLNLASMKDSAPVTLMSTDIEAIVVAGANLHDLWASLIELPIGIYLLYRQVGVPSLFILIPGLVTSGMSGLISPAMGPARVKWNQAIQERVGMASTMLSHMKSVKMMGLSSFIHDSMQKLRVDELKLSVKFRWLLIHLNTLAILAEEFTPVIIILAAIFWTKAGEGLTINEAFTSLTIINIASKPLVLILVSVMQVFGALGCFTRLQAFLELEEMKDGRELITVAPKTFHLSEAQHLAIGPVVYTDPDVELKELVPRESTPSSLDLPGPALTIEGGTFVVGDGIEVLRNINLSVRQRSLSMIIGKVGCGKSSLLKAIAGEIPMSKGRVILYSRSIAYCDQAPWLQNITIRDNILGQSPLDEDWLDRVIWACALDVDCAILPLGDGTVVGSGGMALSGGQRQRVALARAIYSRQSLLVLDDVFSGLDSTTSKAIFQRLLSPNGLLRQGNSTVIMATNHVNFLPAADFVTLLEKGTILQNQVGYSVANTSICGTLESVSEGNDTASESEEDEPMKRLRGSARISETALETKADLSRQTGDVDCYKIYMRSLGAIAGLTVLVGNMAHAAMQKMPQVWLRLWTEKGTSPGDLDFMGGYIGFTCASMIIATVSIAYFIVIGVPRSANNLHELLLNTVVRAPLYFFTSTDSGSTLNRFSQDMTLIDEELPISFFTAMYLVFRAMAETALIASGATYVGAFIPLCFLALYFVQKYYLRTSRQMRFLDLEMKTPLYTQFTETLAGLATVRSFCWSVDFLHANHRILDTSQKPFYMMFCIQRWLQVVLDLFVAGMALVLVSFALKLTGTSSKGAIGLAMVNLIGFNQTLTKVIEQWTRLETSLGAIARLKWFVRSTSDENKEGEEGILPGDWPANGAIEIDNVTASYSDGIEPALKDVSIKIGAGQKVAICGRSGSGKSSLVLTLLRLLDLRSGTIRIDGLDLSTIPRQQIRARLTTLPQDPLKLSGTVRHNLDPEGRVQADESLIDVLRKTSIWYVMAARGGLDADMDELGFSTGQQQLFCLSRALLSPSRVLLLDEATSSVDRRTDDEIRRVVKEEMGGRTVIEVAHRLEAVRDYDVVVLMGEGRVQEVGAPEDLLMRDSKFRSLWESQGL